MGEKKVIAVAGAAGSQGGGAARANLADPDSGFTVRALTRNPDSPAAGALAELGAEVVHADFHDEPTVHKAFEGAYGAFLVTSFWAHGSAAKETEEVENLVRAAKATGLRHVVWSTLEDTRELLPLEDERAGRGRSADADARVTRSPALRRLAGGERRRHPGGLTRRRPPARPVSPAGPPGPSG